MSPSLTLCQSACASHHKSRYQTNSNACSKNPSLSLQLQQRSCSLRQRQLHQQSLANYSLYRSINSQQSTYRKHFEGSETRRPSRKRKNRRSTQKDQIVTHITNVGKENSEIVFIDLSNSVNTAPNQSKIASSSILAPYSICANLQKIQKINKSLSFDLPMAKHIGDNFKASNIIYEKPRARSQMSMVSSKNGFSSQSKSEKDYSSVGILLEEQNGTKVVNRVSRNGSRMRKAVNVGNGLINSQYYAQQRQNVGSYPNRHDSKAEAASQNNLKDGKTNAIQTKQSLINGNSSRLVAYNNLKVRRELYRKIKALETEPNVMGSIVNYVVFNAQMTD